jgi:hypothetical protein
VKTLAGGAAGNSSGGAADDKKGNATAGADYTMGGKKETQKMLLCPRFEVKKKTIYNSPRRKSFDINQSSKGPSLDFAPPSHSLNKYRLHRGE